MSIVLLQASQASDVLNISSHEIMVESNPYHYYYVKSSKKDVSSIILLTGYATTSNFWNKKFIRCLSQNYNLYLLDYKGINQNISKSNIPESSIQDMAEDVNKFVTTMNLENSILIGWSMGGAVAITASFLNPNYTHLYLLAPVVPNNGGGKLLYTKSPLTKFTPNDIYDYVFNNNIYGYESMNRNILANQFIESNINSLFPSSEVISAQRNAIDLWVENSEVAKEFANSKAPMTFILPDHDGIINQGIATQIINHYKNKKIINLKNVGHAVSFQDPDKVCKIID